MQQFNYGYYRAYFKGRYELDGLPIASTRILSFNIREDLLTTQNSSFTVEAVPDAVSEGDVLIVIDPFGSKLYTGVVKSLEDYSIDCKDILTLFDDSDLYLIGSYSNVNCHTRTKYILQHYRNNNISDPKITTLIDQFNFIESKEYDRNWTFNYTEVHEKNVYDLLMLQYSRYNSKIAVDISIDDVRPTISTAHVKTDIINLVDNTVVLPTIEPIIEAQDVNKLIIYSADYANIRGTYFLTSAGVTTDPQNLLRINIINTKIVNSDDELLTIVNSELGNTLYSHQLKVDMIPDNKLYDYFSFQLGGQFVVSVNNSVYDTIYTAYELDFPLDVQKCENVRLTFGTVRKRASERYFQ